MVAASGTALTLDQLRTLSKLTKNIKISFDADRAGLAATERVIEMGQKLGLTLRMVEMPEGAKDADELIAKDVDAWKQAILGAKYIVDYLFDRFEKDFDLSSAVGKRGYADRLAANLRRLGDPVEQDHYVKLLAEKTGTSEDAVKAKLAKGDGSAAPSSGADNANSGLDGDQPVRRAVVQAEGRPTARRLLEESLLAITLMDPATRLSLEDLEASDFSSPERAAIFDALNARRDEPGMSVANTLTEATDYVKIILLRGEQEFADLAPADRSFEAFGLARRLQMASNKDVKQILSSKLREAETIGDVQLVGKLLHEYQKLLDEEI